MDPMLALQRHAVVHDDAIMYFILNNRWLLRFVERFKAAL